MNPTITDSAEILGIVEIFVNFRIISSLRKRGEISHVIYLPFNVVIYAGDDIMTAWSLTATENNADANRFAGILDIGSFK